MRSHRRLIPALLATVGFSTAAVAQHAALDSVVLERTACFGTCPAYRLTVTATGKVRFASRNRGDTARAAEDSISPAAMTTLLAAAFRLRALDLPARIADDHALCPDRATDHPTVTVGLFWPAGQQQIVDYHGCYLSSDHSVADRLGDLRRFETTVDSVTQSQRWVRPNRR
jgi:hypothetical protein